MELSAVLKTPGLKESAAALKPNWASSQRAMPKGRLSFLAEGFVIDGCKKLYLRDEIIDLAVDASRRVEVSPALRALAWHCHYSLLYSETFVRDVTVLKWPSIEALRPSLGGDADLFYLVILISTLPTKLPQMRAVHRKHSVPPEIVRDTMRDLEIEMSDYRQTHGRWGMPHHLINWFALHLSGELYRLGRLNFEWGEHALRLRAYRHRRLGTVVALSENGVRYLAGGQLEGGRRGADSTATWTAMLSVTKEKIIGNPIWPAGAADKTQVCLSKGDWQQVLAPGDPVFHVHVPSDGPLAFDSIGDAFQKAIDFFGSHFLERSFVGFSCVSWFLDAKLQQLLPGTSNIVRFQKEVYLVPALSGDRHLLEAAFNGVPEDLSNAPRETTLQRALLDSLREGNLLHSSAGGCLLFPQDLRWGGQVYRKQDFHAVGLQWKGETS